MGTPYRWLLLALLAAALSGCGADFWAFGTDHLSGAGTTTLVVRWSDSPVDEAEAVRVTLDSVELSGPTGTVVLSRTRRTYELLALQNGVAAEIARAEVEVGRYDRVRLTLAPDGAFHHEVVIDGRRYELGLSGPASRVLDIPHALELVEDVPKIVHVDFNVRLSVVQSGDEWTLTPRVSALDPDRAGRLLGRVSETDGTPVAGATVSAQQAGREILSTRTSADGTYELGPLAPGGYALVFTAYGHASQARGGVTVFQGVETSGHDAALTVVTPGHVTGSAPVGLGGLTVRVLGEQGLIDLAGVDPVTGAFHTPRLPPGTYTFELWDDLGPIQTRAGVVVTAGGTAVVSF